MKIGSLFFFFFESDFLHAPTHACASGYVYSHVCTHACANVCVYSCAHTCLCKCACVYSHAHMCLLESVDQKATPRHYSGATHLLEHIIQLRLVKPRELPVCTPRNCDKEAELPQGFWKGRRWRRPQFAAGDWLLGGEGV